MNPSALVVAVSLSLVGCTQDSPTGENIGPGNPDPNGDPYACHSDADCADPDAAATTCAVDGTCSPVRVAHVDWTVGGEPASTETCAAAPNLDLSFSYDDQVFGYSPVPCAEGQMTIDSFPVEYMTLQAYVILIRAGDKRGEVWTQFDYATGTATLRLPYDPEQPSEN
jgi:hypothetical protein